MPIAKPLRFPWPYQPSGTSSVIAGTKPSGEDTVPTARGDGARVSGIWENASLDEGEADDTFGEEGRAVSADVGDVVEHALSTANAARQMATRNDGL